MLGGVLTVNAVGGVATFSGLSIDRIGIAYQLSAFAPGLSGADSEPFNITANQLVFTTSPSNSTAGVAFPTQPTLTAVDGFGTLDTNFNSPVTVALKPGTAGATLGGTMTVNAVNGVASFSGLSIDLAGTAYQLIAASGPIDSTATGDSAPFDITAGPATRLVFTSSPSDSTAGMAFPSQPVVAAQDGFGNLDTSFAGAVTLAIHPGTGAAGATLDGALTVNAVNGVASFSGLSIDLAGTDYVLTATSESLADGASSPFNITAAPAAELIFTVSPSDSTARMAFPSQPVVAARDAFGNLATGFHGAVTVAIKPGTGTAGATLAGAATVNAVDGVATFSGLSIDQIGTDYQLIASATGLSEGLSAPFSVRAQSFQVFLPAVQVPGVPDLVGSFTLSKRDPAPGEPVQITVTITNTGTGPAGPFWVDFYINPTDPPTAANQTWDTRCGTSSCPYGLVWSVNESLAPGESVTLTSLPTSYQPAYTSWPGSFQTTPLDLYLYVDSWNPDDPNGAVRESNEANNLARLAP